MTRPKVNGVPKSKRVEIEEICEDLGIGRSLAYEEIRSGRIPSITMGARRRIVPRAAYEKWLATAGMESVGAVSA
jgi:excisionase family DNA binding protein